MNEWRHHKKTHRRRSKQASSIFSSLTHEHKRAQAPVARQSRASSSSSLLVYNYVIRLRGNFSASSRALVPPLDRSFSGRVTAYVAAATAKYKHTLEVATGACEKGRGGARGRAGAHCCAELAHHSARTTQQVVARGSHRDILLAPLALVPPPPQQQQQTNHARVARPSIRKVSACLGGFVVESYLRLPSSGLRSQAASGLGQSQREPAIHQRRTGRGSRAAASPKQTISSSTRVLSSFARSPWIQSSAPEPARTFAVEKRKSIEVAGEFACANRLCNTPPRV